MTGQPGRSLHSSVGSLVCEKLPHFETDSCEVDVTIPISQVQTHGLEGWHSLSTVK